MTWNPYENLPPAASFSLTSTDLREGEKLAMPQVSGVFGPRDAPLLTQRERKSRARRSR